MRWNETLDQESAYAQPCDRTGFPCLSYHHFSHDACSRVVW